jgi:anti-sigma-K factor RskA
MKLEHPDLVDRLAAEYVLGTLRGTARRRFERAAGANARVGGAVRRWEDRFMGLAPGASAVRPSRRVWAGIVRQVEALEHTDDRGSGARAWQFALAAVLIGVVVALGWYRFVYEPRPQAAAVFASTTGTQLWRVEVSRDTTQLHMATLGPVPLEPGHSFELWALPAGGKPVSLGLMPTAGTANARLTDLQRAALLASSKVAISLEPQGGSPTGTPTVVLQVADWVAQS